MRTLESLEEELRNLIEHVKDREDRDKPCDDEHRRWSELGKKIKIARHVTTCEAAIAALETARASALASGCDGVQIQIAHLAATVALQNARVGR